MPRVTSHSSQALRGHKHLRMLFFLYCILLLTEGALRKWFLPSLATPLLLIRDPVALLAIVVAVKEGIGILNKYTIVFICFALLALVTTMTLGHQNLVVAFYGCRAYLLHLLALFAFASAVTRKDLHLILKIVLALALPLMLLNILQLYTPQSAWINRGVAGDLTGSGFGGIRDYSRVAGIFSFTTGNVSFFMIAATSVLIAWFNAIRDNKLLRICASAAVLLGLGVLISRTYVFMFIVLVVSALLPMSLNIRKAVKGAITIIGLVLIGYVVLQFEEASFTYDLMAERFEAATNAEGDFVSGSIGERAFGNFYRAINVSRPRPSYGFGLGYTSNVGSRILFGNVLFHGAEDEWGKTFDEFGLTLGIPVILTRIWLILSLLYRSIGVFFKEGRTDSWLLTICSTFYLLQGDTQQATNLGFFVVIVVLAIVSLKSVRPMSPKYAPQRFYPTSIIK